jgi:hypothetical protein
VHQFTPWRIAQKSLDSTQRKRCWCGGLTFIIGQVTGLDHAPRGKRQTAPVTEDGKPQTQAVASM